LEDHPELGARVEALLGIGDSAKSWWGENCAAAAEIDLFLTNDARLSRKAVEGIKFIATLEAAPL